MSKKRNRPNSTPATDSGRFPAVDALRGMALLAMFAYHFSFDLNYFGLIRQNFYEAPFWIASRTAILSSFLLLVGISLALANRAGIRWSLFFRRLGQITGCAVLVSIGSYAMFPQSWIYFGVLHHIALASVVSLAFLRFEWGNLGLGLFFIGLGTTVKLPLFDTSWLQWIGLMTHKPITEDYVPMLPWFGLVLIGIFAGKRLLSANKTGIKTWRPAHGFSRLLILAGRHSLLLYMVHQPVFIGLLYLLKTSA